VSIERVHGDKPLAPLGLTDVLVEMWSPLRQHLLKERVLFPMLCARPCGPRVFMPVRVMEHDNVLFPRASA
jgi:iron-sulfur cluster repair protein YtfE (RIC family)